MSEGTTREADVIRLRENISTLLRRRVLEAVQEVLDEELAQALGTGRYERSEERRGYRNGHETRRITTEVGPQTLEVPRGRIVEDDGSAREFQSEVVPRYARRTRQVDEAILGAYLAGANTRRRGLRHPPSRTSRDHVDGEATTLPIRCAWSASPRSDRWRWSSLSTISFTDRTSAAVSRVGLLRGQLDRSSSSQRISARRQPW